MIEEGDARVCAQWKTDPFGVGEKLAAKRRQRGWMDDGDMGVEGAAEFLAWRGGETGREPYPGRLPWDKP
jgi:hypothetical protein